MDFVNEIKTNTVRCDTFLLEDNYCHWRGVRDRASQDDNQSISLAKISKPFLNNMKITTGNAKYKNNNYGNCIIHNLQKKAAESSSGPFITCLYLNSFNRMVDANSFLSKNLCPVFLDQEFQAFYSGIKEVGIWI